MSGARSSDKASRTAGSTTNASARATRSDSADWLIPAGAKDAADLGAGTGKFTALLAGRGLHTVAVDPSADMLEQLRRTLPEVTAVEGTAEHTGLPAGAFDLVTVAQAWHWCDPVLASTEIARILRPHGVLGLVWNQLDTSVPWVHRLSRIMHAGDVHKPHFRRRWARSSRGWRATSPAGRIRCAPRTSWS